MAFDFKKEPERPSGEIQNPFQKTDGDSRQGGFSFGGSGGTPTKQERSGDKPSGGFQFGGGNTGWETGGHFPDPPSKSGNGRQTHSYPARRSGGSGRGIRTEDIPWKAIFLLAVVVLAFILIVANWDLIVYVIYNLITLLIALIILVLLLKLLFRRRR